MEKNFFERLAESLGTAVFTVQLPDRLVKYVNPSVETRITYIHGIYTPLYDPKGSIWGVSAFGLDISNRKRVELEKEALIDKLQAALDEVRTLRGILPICASCKKIRDDKGYWNQIETYITKHSQAEFTHSLCQECIKKLYPDLFDEDENILSTKS